MSSLILWAVVALSPAAAAGGSRRAEGHHGPEDQAGHGKTPGT